MIKTNIKRYMAAIAVMIMVITGSAGFVNADYQTTPEVNGSIAVSLPLIVRSDPLNIYPYINVLTFNGQFWVSFSSARPLYISANDYGTYFVYPIGTKEQAYRIAAGQSSWQEVNIQSTEGNYFRFSTPILLYTNCGCVNKGRYNDDNLPMYVNQPDGRFVSDVGATWQESLLKANVNYVNPPLPMGQEYTGVMPPMPSIDDLKITLYPIDITTRLIDETAVVSNTGIQQIDDIINFIYRFFANLYNGIQSLITDIWNTYLMPVMQVIVNVINRFIEIIYPALTAIYNAVANVANNAYSMFMILKSEIRDNIKDTLTAVISIKDKLLDITGDGFKFFFGDVEKIQAKILAVRDNIEALIPSYLKKQEGGGGSHFSVAEDIVVPDDVPVEDIGKGDITIGGTSYHIEFFNMNTVRNTMISLRPKISLIVMVMVFFSDINFLFSITRTQKNSEKW